MQSSAGPEERRVGGLYKSVTVIASTATAADGLSTAFSFLPLTEIELALRTVRDGQVRLTTAVGERIVLTAPGLDPAHCCSLLNVQGRTR